MRHLPRQRLREQRHPQEPRAQQALRRETLRLRVLRRQVGNGRVITFDDSSYDSTLRKTLMTLQ